MATASYTIRVLPMSHELEGEFVLDGVGGAPLRLDTPTWVPGAYSTMKYGRDLFDIAAFDGSGKPIEWSRIDWSGIQLSRASDKVRVTWRAVAYDPAWGELCGIVDHEHAVLRATRYLFSPAHAGPCSVTYALPDGWTLHHPGGSEKRGEKTFAYPSFAALLEACVVTGSFERISRTLDGVAFHHVFLDRAVGFDTEAEKFVDALMKLAEEAKRIFGSFPFRDYTYIFSHSPNAHWGLEHPDCTMIALGENVYVDAAARNAGIRVCGHELFHAWNVCRMKPDVLVQPDLVNPPAIDTLWVAEGVTRYYEFVMGVRAGELTVEQLFSNVVNYYRHLVAIPAGRRIRALDSSRATFLNHTRYPGSINATIDYYDAGMLAAFDVDAALRLSTNEGFDQGLAQLYALAMKQGGGYSQEDALRTLGREAQKLLRERVENPLPHAHDTRHQLAQLGFKLETKQVRYIGIVLAKDNAGPEISHVLDDGPAAKTGLAPGDVITRVDGFPYSLKSLKWLVERREKVQLQISRGHRQLELEVSTDAREDITTLTWVGDDAQLQRIRDWLRRPELAWKSGQAIPLTAYDNFHGVNTVV